MGIPVLDLSEAAVPSDDVVRAWESALLEVGCFSLVNHGIPAAVIEECVAASRAFNDQELERKQRCAMALSLGNKGFIPADPGPAGTGTRRVVRDYASLDIGAESDGGPVESILLGPNLWPELTGFRDAVEAYYQAVSACARAVSQMLARVCGLEPDYLERRSRRGISLLRLLHYPAPAQDLEEPPNGHTDYEWFTLIWHSGPGLEVYGRDGGVHLVPAAPDQITVLVGDLLELLTGGRIESTLHWVRPRDPDRHSLTYFYGPDFDEVIAPTAPRRQQAPDGAPGYPELHAGRHLTALRVRHLPHLRAALHEGTLQLPFPLPDGNPFKAAKVKRLAGSGEGRSQ
ncbi:isopenicillin N synthase family oxygenase [Streptacidiphilus sp. PB12-B1b]|uniref:isopenicillin N synthase family dioxygenase n=1 Tax=Streptacidiphilus sp. PB12-B1b TaxID=2705012 RepID=UPI0015FCD570|nr:isopenicillin N synthase family oxygenase [Streptacidiphilus sp. PB12-B1b]QMU78279.1 isopenicillin N synthase family oxygenase [Streptacidiphilus sp. PB12-B1b]